ncbi:MAG: hypothetical protein K5888_00655 [Lachnospiraceae bacterium]|nr:hypothetical protein [Lachnospiraceae bacterium]
MAIDKKKTIHIILEAANNYEKYLNNRTFLIVYKSGGDIRYNEIVFRNWHFLHLTGLKTNLTAKQFYKACIEHNLSTDDISFDRQGKAEQKLQVLPFLHSLPYHNCMIGDFINSGVLIQADYFIGDTKFVLSVGFRRESTCDIPVTLYKGDIRKLTSPSNRVLVIFTRSYPSKEYKEITYMAKNIILSDLSLPSSVIIPKDSETAD